MRLRRRMEEGEYWEGHEEGERRKLVPLTCSFILASLSSMAALSWASILSSRASINRLFVSSSSILDRRHSVTAPSPSIHPSSQPAHLIPAISFLSTSFSAWDSSHSCEGEGHKFLTYKRTRRN